LRRNTILTQNSGLLDNEEVRKKLLKITSKKRDCGHDHNEDEEDFSSCDEDEDEGSDKVENSEKFDIPKAVNSSNLEISENSEISGSLASKKVESTKTVESPKKIFKGPKDVPIPNSTKTQNHPILEPVMSTASELLSDNSDANLFLSNYLKQGDMIKKISRSVRVQGIDIYEGVFILGKFNIYHIDNLYYDKAKGTISTISDSTPKVTPNTLGTRPLPVPVPPPKLTTFKLKNVTTIIKKRYLLRSCAIEVFGKSAANSLFLAFHPKEMQIPQLIQEMLVSIEHKYSAVGFKIRGFSEFFWFFFSNIF